MAQGVHGCGGLALGCFRTRRFACIAATCRTLFLCSHTVTLIEQTKLRGRAERAGIGKKRRCLTRRRGDTATRRHGDTAALFGAGEGGWRGDSASVLLPSG